jgi:hypothetical protein
MTKLPLIKAPTSNFCGVSVELDLFDTEGEPLAFFLDGNSKITGGNGSYAEPVPNAFSLPAASVDGQQACPGSTEICRASCYVKGLAKHAPEIYQRYAENARVLGLLFAQGEGFSNYAAEVLARWVHAHAPHGFRWHVSGDVMSIDHAAWIAEVCDRAPAVQFWIYTRTLDAVGYLAGCKNLAVNVSADRENLSAARRVAQDYGVRLCYLSDDGHVPELPEGSVIFPDYPLRGRSMPSPTDHAWWKGLTQTQRAMVCPTDFFGQSEAHRCGPCRKCM